MNFEAVAESFRSRMPWRPAQKLFEALGLPRAQGWEKTIEKLQNSGVNFAAGEQRILTALQEHYLCGEKLVRLYHAPSKLRSAILERLLDAKIPESAFQEKYPLVLSTEDLSMRAFQAELINVIELADGVAAIFASVRSAPVREEINLDELPEEIASEFQAYEELVGIRHKKCRLWILCGYQKRPDQSKLELISPQDSRPIRV